MLVALISVSIVCLASLVRIAYLEVKYYAAIQLIEEYENLISILYKYQEPEGVSEFDTLIENREN